MAKSKEKWEFGDFQTPADLADDVCRWLATRNVNPNTIFEPSCGVGAFLSAAAKTFRDNTRILGYDVNPNYLAQAALCTNEAIQVAKRDFFRTDWAALVAQETEPLLVLGNPPWVTSAELGALGSENLPEKSNFQNHSGFDAMTGKANFDISEWMLLENVKWMKNRHGYIAVLCKLSVARKVLRQIWLSSVKVTRTEIVHIDARKHFNAAVDACLFFVEMGGPIRPKTCPVYQNFEATKPAHEISIEYDVLIADLQKRIATRHLTGTNKTHIWRSGIKHDCSKVMELSVSEEGFVNGRGEIVDVERELIFPLYKSSDLAKACLPKHRKVVIATQRNIGDDTAVIETKLPKTWDYLIKNSVKLDARKSSVYKSVPRFSIFGIGDYSYAPYKIAISGFYKSLNFHLIESIDGKPCMVDDTCYFLPAWSRAEALTLLRYLQSDETRAFFESQIFWDEKRPITASILRRLSLDALTEKPGA